MEQDVSQYFSSFDIFVCVDINRIKRHIKIFVLAIGTPEFEYNSLKSERTIPIETIICIIKFEIKYKPIQLIVEIYIGDLNLLYIYEIIGKIIKRIAEL